LSRKRRTKNKQTNIFGIKNKRIEKCVFCEIDIDLDNQIFVCDIKGDVYHMECIDEKVSIINEVRRKEQDQKKQRKD